MKRVLFDLVCILLFVILAPGPLFAETGQKAPAKPRPAFPKVIRLPTPFNRWNSCDLALRLYPNYTCNNGRLDANTAGSIKTVSVWNDRGKKHLLALFEKFEVGEERESSGKSVDIALFDLRNNDIELAAFSKDVLGYREFGGSSFDLAPYKLNVNETALGVRVSPGIQGVEEEELDLFRIEGDRFQRVFSRIMVDTEYYGGYEDLSKKLRSRSILQIVPQNSGMNDFKIITRYHRINEDDEDEKETVRTASELWRWDHNSQAYQLSK